MDRRHPIALVAVFVASLAVAAWSAHAVDALAAPPAAADSTSGVHIHDAWARATPAGAKMGAIYLTIRSDQADRLIAAAVPHSIAGETQIHEVVTVVDSSGGDATPRMSMRPVEAIDLPAGEDVALKPGGFHIMLIELKKPLRPGEHVAVTLTLEKAGKRKVTAVVREE